MGIKSIPNFEKNEGNSPSPFSIFDHFSQNGPKWLFKWTMSH